MELPQNYNPKESEPKWQEFWIKENIYKFDENSKKLVYSIDTPPPTVSGKMHIGHAFSYSHQDIIVRYKRMKGFNIFYPWGFDDNGLATERFVEKKLNIKAVDMKRSDFIKLCLKETTEAEKELQASWKSIGLSPEWSRNYRTIDNDSRKISQLSFIDLYKQGREYRTETVSIFCPTCRTAIAQVELKDKELESISNDIIFKVDGKAIIISTTRPELLGSCVAVFVNPEDEKNKSLIGKKAKVPLFNFEVPILADKRVDIAKGSGIVMCSTFGDLTDIEWQKAYNLPIKISINPDGKLNEISKNYKGLSIHEARKAIIQDLKKENLIVSQKPIKHAVNVHERCNTEIEFLKSKQWFIKYLDLKDKFIELGKKVNWYPAHMYHRYVNWIKGLQWDWCISRQRFFGVPFPVWYCKKCEEIILADEKDLPIDPLETKPKIKECPKCKCKEFIPEKDVIDTWATSSLTPQIALKDKNLFKKIFPMSLRPQSHDIITFWAFNTIVKSWLHEKNIPWKDIMISGYVLSETGEGMSKSKGNIIEPKEMLQKYSADALRFWASSSKLGEDIRYQEKDILTGQKTITKIWNASKFSILNLQDFDFKKPKKIELIDQWILSKLNTLVKDVTDSFDKYEYSKAKSDLEFFFWHVFCDYYLEIIKYRLYNLEKLNKEKRKSAQYTLYNTLLSIIKLYAPIMPHISEEVYQLYFRKNEKQKSIHLSNWPEFSKKLENKKLESIGDLLIEIISQVRQSKTKNNLSLKIPVSSLTLEKKHEKLIKPILQDLKAVTNSEKIEFGDKFEIKF